MTSQAQKRLEARLSLIIRSIHTYHSFHNWTKVHKLQTEAREIVEILKKNA